MEERFYNKFFTVPDDYKANMTREVINETPETWLNFYPHVKYLEFLKTLFDEAKSVWLTGNYGTGKSNAALVTVKLFMDDMSRVEKWFDEHRGVIPNCESLKLQLQNIRNSGVLVIYDYNAAGIGPNEELLVRLEKGILSALREYGYSSPAKGNLDLVIERVRREGDNFFKTRDSIIHEMKSLKSDICTVEQLVTKLIEEDNSTAPTHYLEDVQTVLHRDNIYLDVDVPSFREWISAICKANGLKRIIYIFDEFSDFIDANSGSLKTFEDVTEAPSVNHFYLVPVTHKELGAFYGENSPGANKAKDRFYFRNLQMPNDVAFRLAAYAMKPNEEEPYCSEWKKEKDFLWSSISAVVDKFKDPESSEAYVARESFYAVLPIHPMAAFLLKFLAESARSSQRSIFEYLKGSADGREFQEFIACGGPQITGRQFLTVDYLWKYFMEREDSGQAKEIIEIKMEYDRIKAREFAAFGDDQPEIRILKTVLLFTLLSRLNPNGHERLQPTVENIELSFRGDGVVMDVEMYLRDLSENRHCFSIVNGNIDLYTTTVGSDELNKKKQELSGQFYELLSPVCKTDMEKATKSARAGFSNERFDIRVSDSSHMTLTNITSATREKYSRGNNKDNGSVCLWFVVAKNKTDQMQIQGRRESLLTNLQGHRIIIIDFPEITFCGKNINLWEEYVTLYSQYLLENSDAAKKQISDSIKRIEAEWTESLRSSEASLNLSYYNTESKQIETRKSSWADFRFFLPVYMGRVMEACPDILTEQITAFSNSGLKSWALAGIRFCAVGNSGQQKQLINNLSNRGINGSDDWFLKNQDHPFGRIRSVLEKKYKNTVGNNTNFSLRKVYIELQRAPFGLRYNCLSAFTLGFCLSWILDKNCQWTNGQMNYPLDEETLAEIIEKTVSLKNDKEKFICRLSKEDRIFAKKAACMFGLHEIENSTPLETLRVISSNVEENSCKVPLWVLAEYIRSTKPEHENIASVLDKLCIAFRISSKGKTEERSAATFDIGAELLKNDEIIDIAAKYTKSDVYITAFQRYIDSCRPELMKLAENIGDRSHEYCSLILEKAAPVSGWLWNKSDISGLIDLVECMYRVVEKVRRLLNITGYITYEDVLVRLKKKMEGTGFPYAFVGEKYPVVEAIAEELKSEQDAQKLLECIQNSENDLSLLYNDPQYSIQKRLLRERLGENALTDNELSAIINDMPVTEGYSVNMSSDAYIKLVRDLAAKNVRNTIINKNAEECRRICGFDNISEWCGETHLPAWTLFSETDNSRELVRILIKPENFTNDILEKAHEILTVLPKAEIKHCQNVFLQKAVPEKYKVLNVGLASLLRFLTDNYGKDPNKWPENPNILAFIKEQYQEEFAPAVTSRLRLEKAEILKEKLLKMAKTDPDIGLKFLEQ
ncbi:MAG: hypothetical protein LIO87_07710 [Eubacterium sp.]|nr:hypothetical protein [Eubacterium sp.]